MANCEIGIFDTFGPFPSNGREYGIIVVKCCDLLYQENWQSKYNTYKVIKEKELS